MSEARLRAFACFALCALVAWPAKAQTPPLRPDPRTPLSSVVAVVSPNGEAIPAMVREQVEQYAKGTLPAAVQLPLPNAAGDNLRVLCGLQSNVVVSWLDPLTRDESVSAPRFGANNDFIAYFGDGWNADWKGSSVGGAPQFAGSGRAGWLWVNHEYVSNEPPTATTAPKGQHLTLATFLRDGGALALDPASPDWTQEEIDTYIRSLKRQVGGSWVRVELDPTTLRWKLVRDERNRRYDATSNTRLTVTGQTLRAVDHDDSGAPLPAGVVSGIMSDCSGGQTPWGTVITAEENVQDSYGDLEATWTQDNRFVAGQGFDPGGFIAPPLAASEASVFGAVSKPAERHSRDLYGYLAEIDPGAAPGAAYHSARQKGDGTGHRKIGSIGRARWENTTFAVGADWKLLPGQPVVLYSGDDRRSGRVYKWVSREPYRAGMSRAEVRALLDEGSLYAAHFAGLDNTTGLTMFATGLPPTEDEPGKGRWIHLSTESADVAPNAAELGAPGTTVGAALKNVTWNNLGGFRDDDDLRLALFTATHKIGAMELNRPEDVEWNARDRSGTPRIYVSFTNFNGQTALNQLGVLWQPAEYEKAVRKREDKSGAIFALQEENPREPGRSKAFTYFSVWQGTAGVGPFDAANPDNLLIDKDGGVWFGTDGNFGRNATADALYYLDLDPKHCAGQAGVVRPTCGKAFRIAAVPSDAEATGPAFSADQATIFLSVQHPGEEKAPSTWPEDR